MEQRGYERSFYSKNSLATRSVQIRRYLIFVEEVSIDRSPIPCSSERVALYATWLARDLSYRSILNYLSGLNFFLKQNGSGGIVYDDYIVAATLKGIRRGKGDAPRRAPPMLPSMMLKIFDLLTASPGHTAWRAAMLLSFRALLRKSQVTESEASLLRSDFSFFDWGMIVKVRKCKTIQFGERVLEIPVSRCCKTDLCAVHWTARHFAEVPADQGDIAFRIPAGRGSLPMTYGAYQAMLKRFSNMAGLGECEFTSHSLRRGGTYLAMCGASIEEIKVRGDWASETVYAYLKTPLQVRIINDIRVSSTLSQLE